MESRQSIAYWDVWILRQQVNCQLSITALPPEVAFDGVRRDTLPELQIPDMKPANLSRFANDRPRMPESLRDSCRPPTVVSTKDPHRLATVRYPEALHRKCDRDRQGSRELQGARGCAGIVWTRSGPSLRIRPLLRR